MELYKQAKAGDVIVPEMGKERSLSEILEMVLQKKGLTLKGDKAYPIEVIGMRPGEKLHEKLTWDDEEIIYKSKAGVIVRR